MDNEVIKGYVTIIVFPQRSYKVLNRSPSNPDISDSEIIKLLIART